MRFWDSSALVPLLIEESHSESARRIHREDSEVAAWWATDLECGAALARREREGVDRGQIDEARARLATIRAGWHEVAPTSLVKRGAMRLVRVHALRAADALQLAAAVVAADGRTEDLGLVTLDARLAAAAHREGFPVLTP